MKVRLTIDFDLPASFTELSDSELRMLFYEEVIRKVHQAHLEDVLEMEAAKAGVIGTDEEKQRHLAILEAAKQDYLVWTKITDVPEWWINR